MRRQKSHVQLANEAVISHIDDAILHRLIQFAQLILSRQHPLMNAGQCALTLLLQALPVTQDAGEWEFELSHDEFAKKMSDD
jgi:hypothetical protein